MTMPSTPLETPVVRSATPVDQQHSTEQEQKAYTQDMYVPQLVAAQARAHPHTRALIACSKILTYSELDGRANQIAHYLHSFGVGPETLVGICLERSIAQVVSALGILKSGGAYLPLDPAYPAERLAFMLKDAQAPVLLTKRQFGERLPPGKWKVIDLDMDESQILRYPADSPEHTASGKNLAYVIYTSGSTGLPKGVEITHDSLLNLVRWHQGAFSVTPSDRATQLASPGFDAAVWELWPYLTAGASVSLPGDGVLDEPEALRDWLVAQGITITFVPTPLAEGMLALNWPSNIPLRLLLTGADTLRKYPSPGFPFTLINNYGPTECTVVASSGPVPSNERPNGLPPIGRPIANTEIYILDDQMQQASMGLAGEMYIGGAGIARGYLNRPELTRQRFVPSPFSDDPNARLYRTGDLARYLPDGQIEFLGRLDEQIKVRGYRVEPNEIVTALNEHPSVLASAVAAREGGGGDKYLVGYLVLNSASQPTATAIQDFLRLRLPGYMVPSVFVRLKALPLTSNGKIDRGSLPAPSATNTIVDTTHVAPRTVLERHLSGILAKLLNVDEVGVDDNFFLLGGHSLLAAQLIGSVRDMFGVELPLRTIFDSPTVAGLSRRIQESLLAKVEAMSQEEVRRALAQAQG